MIRNLEELWRFRILVWALVRRHLNARYRGSFFGFLWSFLNPLCLIAVYSLVFRYYVRVDHVEHYTLFMFAGLLPWVWFSGGLLEATSAISSGGSLVTKAMLPPQVLPTVATLTSLANFLFTIPLLIGVMILNDVNPGIELVMLPVIVIVELIFLLGLSLILAALNVRYRDVQHILGNVLTLWFFLCPIIYPASNVPEKLRFTMWLNPVALFTEMYQDIFVFSRFPDLQALSLTALVALTTFLLGNIIFNHYRDEFAELV